MRYPRYLFLLGSIGLALPAAAAEAVDFNRDIRPILSDKCFRCHGPDPEDRKGGQNGLRLDTREGAMEDLGGGGFAIVPGNPDRSELLARIASTDDEEVMPPRDAGKQLTTGEKELLRRWIAQGAPYAQHWSYEPPRQAALPAVKAKDWPRNPVDHFILARLEKAGLPPQPEADRATLARRVALDLTGLPPTLAEVEAFAADRTANAYESFVDRQLAKPSFGEHWARLWLDVARYADSKGYADDQLRSAWRYRDYVIDAFNRNVRFDQFTVEQLAGDLLPKPTDEQLFATGFHRNTMTNTEGGTDDEEFRVAAVLDRVDTTMAAWMGTSIACAQCHTHKYDPLTQKEYFQLYAIFNQTEDADRADDAPFLEFYTAEQLEQRRKWEQELATLGRDMLAAKAAHAPAAAAWARSLPATIGWQSPAPRELRATNGGTVVADASGLVTLTAAKNKENVSFELPAPSGVPLTAFQLQALPVPPAAATGARVEAERDFVVTRIRLGVTPAEPTKPGRFVRIDLAGKNRTLALAEVEVFSGGRNVAAQGKVSQASVAEAAAAERAIDGVTDGAPAKSSLSITEAGENPWWEIDLGATVPLEKIVVWGRTGLEPTPAGLRVTVLDENRQPVWEQRSREAPKPSRTFSLNDPRELKLGRAFASAANTDFDENFALADELKPHLKKRGALRRGWALPPGAEGPQTLAFDAESPVVLAPGEKLIVTLEQQFGEVDVPLLKHFRVSATTDSHAGQLLRMSPAARAALAVPAAERTAAQEQPLLEHYLRHIAPELAPARKRVGELEQSLAAMPSQTQPIMRELPPEKQRKSHVHLRGNYRALGEEVTPGVPAAFPGLPAGTPVNRLTFAQWLVDAKNPLTARVQVNRFWEAIFGLGIVRTPEEFGSQGERPSHPELLDWLAVDFMTNGWDVKRLLKLYVTSAAYRQSSRVTAAAVDLDPENRLLSRGPRFRLTAEMVRDQALAVSGLLSAKMHGPSARPFQPAFGLSAAFGSGLDWTMSEGEDRLRRALYTEWRRSSPYPSMVTFDAPNREVCTLRRARSNTPLQALVTLNDPVYVEAAQALGRLIASGPGALEAKIADGFRRVLFRPPSAKELGHLAGLYAHAREVYAQAPEQAAALSGPAKGNAMADAADLAAWTAVANVLLNLDEALMKP